MCCKKREFLKEGIRLKHKEKRSKTILTLEGQVTFSRAVYVPTDKESAELLLELHGLKTVAPLDIALGLNNLPFKISVAMMLDIARRSINAHSYEELQSSYLKDWHIKISDDQIRVVTNYLGRIVYEHDCLQREEALEHLKKGVSKHGVKSGELYVEMDGAMFNTRYQENGSTWKENKLGLVFSSRNVTHFKTAKGKEYHKILSREYISFVGSADTFKEHLYAVALRNGLEEHEKIIVLSDGAAWIKGFIADFCQGLDAIQILDYTHLKENIFKFANTFIRGKNAKHTWAEALKELVKNGKVDEAIKMAEPYKDCKKPGIPNIYSYLVNNRDCINYPEYVKNNYFIGSGAIESGNRSTMQERLKLPGMRWDIQTAQYVLALKMKYDSGLWDSLVVPLVYKHFGLVSPY